MSTRRCPVCGEPFTDLLGRLSGAGLVTTDTDAERKCLNDDGPGADLYLHDKLPPLLTP